MNFDFDSQTRRKLGYQLIEVVDRFFTSLADRPVQPAAEDRIYSRRLSRLPETGKTLPRFSIKSAVSWSTMGSTFRARIILE
jgi:hypothetical protein